MNDFYVYGLFDPKTNSCFYVGKGKGSRLFSHEKKVKRGSTTQNPHLDRKIKKVLDESGYISYVKFLEDLDEDLAFDHEDKKIREFDITNLCNVWYGGVGGRVPSDEVRRKISENRKGIPVSAKTREKIRKAKLGTTLSEETKRKKSQALKGKPQTKKQQKANTSRSKALKGRTFTDAHKQKLREAKLKNPVRYWLGKNLSEETKQKISESVRKHYEQA